jgi:hypothetical protein
MVAVLLVVGGLATPVTGLLIRPDVRGARHGVQMIVDVGRFGWYGYVVVSVVVLAVALTGVVRGTPDGRRRAAGAAVALLVLTPIFGTVHAYVVTKGMFYGDGRPMLAAVAALVALAAVAALVLARIRLRAAAPAP